MPHTFHTRTSRSYIHVSFRIRIYRHDCTSYLVAGSFRHLHDIGEVTYVDPTIPGPKKGPNCAGTCLQYSSIEFVVLFFFSFFFFTCSQDIRSDCSIDQPYLSRIFATNTRFQIVLYRRIIYKFHRLRGASGKTRFSHISLEATRLAHFTAIHHYDHYAYTAIASEQLYTIIRYRDI